ncbi:MAG: hypothetical protein AAF825_11295 [Pseudomonadota bacterium]
MWQQTLSIIGEFTPKGFVLYFYIAVAISFQAVGIWGDQIRRGRRGSIAWVPQVVLFIEFVGSLIIIASLFIILFWDGWKPLAGASVASIIIVRSGVRLVEGFFGIGFLLQLLGAVSLIPLSCLLMLEIFAQYELGT